MTDAPPPDPDPRFSSPSPSSDLAEDGSSTPGPARDGAGAEVPTTAPGETSAAGAVPPAPDDDAEFLVEALSEAPEGRIRAAIAVVRRGLRGLCWLAGASAVAALGLTISASRQPVAAGVVVLVAAVTIGAAILVARRVRLLAQAVANPKEVVAEARQLAGHLTDSPQLRDLAGMVRRRSAGSGGRIRRALRTGRTVSAVIGLAGPDPKAQPHLSAIAPDRLRGLWIWAIVGVVGWALCGLVAFGAALALIAQAIT